MLLKELLQINEGSTVTVDQIVDHAMSTADSWLRNSDGEEQMDYDYMYGLIDNDIDDFFDVYGDDEGYDRDFVSKHRKDIVKAIATEFS